MFDGAVQIFVALQRGGDTEMGFTEMFGGRCGKGTLLPGFRQPVQRFEDVRQVLMGLRVVSLEPRGLLELGDCFVKLLLLEQGNAEIFVRFKISRMKLYHPAEMSFGFGGFSHTQQYLAEIVVGVYVIRIEVQRAMKMRHGLTGLSSCSKANPRPFSALVKEGATRSALRICAVASAYCPSSVRTSPRL